MVRIDIMTGFNYDGYRDGYIIGLDGKVAGYFECSHNEFRGNPELGNILAKLLGDREINLYDVFFRVDTWSPRKPMNIGDDKYSGSLSLEHTRLLGNWVYDGICSIRDSRLKGALVE